jgi:hypothetical protein
MLTILFEMIYNLRVVFSSDVGEESLCKKN